MRDEGDMHQPSYGGQFITMTDEEMKGECCKPVEPYMICLRSNCTSFMQMVEGPPFSSTPADPEWTAVTRDPQWGENSVWVVEQVEKRSEWTTGMECACEHCYDGPGMLKSIWPAANGVCTVLGGTKSDSTHDSMHDSMHDGSASGPA
jgi:hypothetical protein